MRDGIWLDVVDSTLDEIHGRAAAGAADGSWLAAREQRAGRGSRGRTWHSARGGLWLSVLRRGPGRITGFELLSIRAGLAVAQVLDGLPPVAPVMLKWPNDLMVHDRKVGGLLAEARWQGDRLLWVAIGLGLNVSNEIPVDLADRATALRAYCTETTVEALAGPVARALGGIDLETPLLTDDELAAYARRDWVRGRAMLTPVRGVADGVGGDGRLTVRDARGAGHLVSFGDVSWA